MTPCSSLPGHGPSLEYDYRAHGRRRRWRRANRLALYPNLQCVGGRLNVKLLQHPSRERVAAHGDERDSAIEVLCRLGRIAAEWGWSRILVSRNRRLVICRARARRHGTDDCRLRRSEYARAAHAPRVRVPGRQALRCQLGPRRLSHTNCRCATAPQCTTQVCDALSSRD